METIRQLFLRHLGQTSQSPMMIEVARAEGVYLYTPDGRAVIDLVAGVSVSNVGHANRAVIEAVKAQAEDYMHTMVYGDSVQKVQVEYAQLLTQHLPQSLDSVYFVNSGAEAIEGAMKLAKRHTGRTEIVSMTGAYHGSTQGALSIQGGEFFKTAFRPLLPDCRQMRYNCREDLNIITRATACVVCEVVQGEGGVRPGDREWLQALRTRCTEVGALLIFDEIQTGFGRTGTLFGMQKIGVTPDIVCLGKALGGGMPLGAFISGRDVMWDLTFSPPLGHITTFGGNPVCCAAGMAALKFILSEGLCARAEAMGALFEERVQTMPRVKEVRRSGLLLAVELGDSALMYRAVELLTARGIMTDWFLFCDTAFRISPPLIITEEEVHEACDIIEQVLATL